MTNILNLPRFSKTSFAIVLLLVTALALPAAAQTLTPSEIDALKAQLVEARDVYNALGARVPCYVDKDASFQAHSSQLQQTAGDLHRQEQKLSSELAQKKSEAEAFRYDFEAAQQKMLNLKRKMSKIQDRIRGSQVALDECKSKWWTINFLCDVAGEIIGLKNDLSKLSAEGQATDIKARSLQKPLREAQIRQTQAVVLLQGTQSALEQTKRDIEVAEAEIKVIKASLSEIRTVKQDYSTELVQFQEAFTEFKGLDPSSDRRSVVRRLRRESADLDDLLVKARVLLDENGLRLPSGERICAN